VSDDAGADPRTAPSSAASTVHRRPIVGVAFISASRHWSGQKSTAADYIPVLGLTSLPLEKTNRDWFLPLAVSATILPASCQASSATFAAQSRQAPINENGGPALGLLMHGRAVLQRAQANSDTSRISLSHTCPQVVHELCK
jgi:hypothetical protein